MTASRTIPTVLEVARTYLAAGLSFCPIGLNGRKTPDGALCPEYLDDDGRVKRGWNPLQERLPTADELGLWYDRSDPRGIAVIGGGVSGNKEALDFDRRAQEVFPVWRELVEVEAPGLVARLCVVQTPRETIGYHVHYRCEVPVSGNTTLAREVVGLTDKGKPDAKILIETRGEGGYILVPGSPGACHDTGGTYEYLPGPDLAHLPVLTADEREVLFRCARSFDRMAEQESSTKQARQGEGGLRPGDDFDQRGPDWPEILEPHGWVVARQTGEETWWRRPGKDRSWSATTGHCHGKNGEPLFRVFTSNAYPFEDGRSYGKFRTYAILNCDGDLSMAARNLVQEGYGEQRQRSEKGPSPSWGGKRHPAGGSAASVGKYRPLPPWQPFPVDALPPIVRDLVREASASICCDPSMVALPALATIAAAVGLSRAVILKDGWTEPACIWSLVIADSGTGKTPAWRVATAPAVAIQVREVRRRNEAQSQYEAELARIKALPREQRPEEPAEPAPARRYVTSDTTIEALGMLLQQTPRGLLVSCDEMDGWFCGFTRYNKSGGGTDRPRWLELHSAGNLTVDRVGRPALFVPSALASVCGSIQPGVYSRAMDREALASGLGARLASAMPPRVKKRWNNRGLSERTRQEYHDLVEALYALPWQGEQDREATIVGLSLPTQLLWAEHYDRWADLQHESEGEKSATLAKLEAYTPRLALLHHLCTRVSRGECDTWGIDPASLHAAMRLVEWFAHEADRIHAMLGEQQDDRDLRRLVEWIREQGGTTTAKRLQRASGRRYPSTADANAALDHLANLGLGTWHPIPAGPRGGRPSRRFVLNPSADSTDSTDATDETDETPCRPHPPGQGPADETPSADETPCPGSTAGKPAQDVSSNGFAADHQRAPAGVSSVSSVSSAGHRTGGRGQDEQGVSSADRGDSTPSVGVSSAGTGTSAGDIRREVAGVAGGDDFPEGDQP